MSTLQEKDVVLVCRSLLFSIITINIENTHFLKLSYFISLWMRTTLGLFVTRYKIHQIFIALLYAKQIYASIVIFAIRRLTYQFHRQILNFFTSSYLIFFMILYFYYYYKYTRIDPYIDGFFIGSSSKNELTHCYM